MFTARIFARGGKEATPENIAEAVRIAGEGALSVGDVSRQFNKPARAAREMGAFACKYYVTGTLPPNGRASHPPLLAAAYLNYKSCVPLHDEVTAREAMWFGTTCGTRSEDLAI